MTISKKATGLGQISNVFRIVGAQRAKQKRNYIWKVCRKKN